MEVPEANGLAPKHSQASTMPVLRIRPSSRGRANLLLDLPIAGRLTLGFLTAAVIAALVTGIIGVVRAQSLNRQANFYQSLLQTNTSLTTGADFLQLLNTEMQQLVDNAAGPNPSKETIATEEQAIQGLTSRYGTLLNQYVSHNLLNQHPDQVSLLAEGNHSTQVTQQLPLVGSTLRTWRVYQASQEQILHSIQTGNTATAQNFWHVQGEPTNADAQSALRSLILFDQRLSSSVQDAANIEELNQVLSTIIGAIIAFILIAAVGWFISSTLVQRLKQLRQITQAVEQGELNARVPVIGRDEIADVAASFNGMLATIVGLLEETRQQRDALTNAADHLFSDMRIVSSGDLRINASVSNDPIGMLANAFNFTVGRFRRFVLRVQGTIEQLDVISRQEFEHAEAFVQVLPAHIQQSSPAINKGSNSALPLQTLLDSNGEQGQISDEDKELIAQLQHIRGRLQQLSSTGISKYAHALESLLTQVALIVKQLNTTMTAANTHGATQQDVSLYTSYLEDIRTLEASLQNMKNELQNVQKNVTNGFIEADTNLTRISARIHTIKARPTTRPLTQPLVKELSPDLTRQSLGFAQEITVMARQLATLVQEMRTAIISFELDGINTDNPLPLQVSAGHQQRKGKVEGKRLPEGIRTRNQS